MEREGKLTGIWAAGVTYLSGTALSGEFVQQLVLAFVAGLMSVLGALAAIGFKYYLESQREAARVKGQQERKEPDSNL